MLPEKAHQLLIPVIFGGLPSEKWTIDIFLIPSSLIVVSSLTLAKAGPAASWTIAPTNCRQRTVKMNAKVRQFLESRPPAGADEAPPDCLLERREGSSFPSARQRTSSTDGHSCMSSVFNHVTRS